MKPVLEIRGVSNIYIPGGELFGRKRARKVLDGINMEIAPGEIFGLAGESGCGIGGR
jgi:oligopeptide transport system ATP-binding protein